MATKTAQTVTTDPSSHMRKGHRATLTLRFQPQSELSQWYYRRVGELVGRMRRIMVIALARKLVIALWRYAETGLIPKGAIVAA
jgi:transposase